MAEDQKVVNEQQDVDDAQKTEDIDKKENTAPEGNGSADGAGTPETEETAEGAGTGPDGAGTEGPEADSGEASGEAASAEEDGKEAKASKPDKKDKQIEELTDKYKRLFAEFDNYRKRTESEKTMMFNDGQKAVLMKVLPLIDNFERALGAVPEDQKDSPMAQGIEKIYRSFMDQLTEMGVKPIEAVGQPFDANYHNAVMHVEDDSLEENIVAEEFQKGYLFKDKVLRYSMVKVAN